jgi:hypothetical protein
MIEVPLEKQTTDHLLAVGALDVVVTGPFNIVGEVKELVFFRLVGAVECLGLDGWNLLLLHAASKS